MKKEEYRILSCLKKNLESDVKIFFKPFLNGEILDVVLVKEGSGVIIVSLSDLEISRARVYDKKSIVLDDKIKMNPLVKVKEGKDSLFSFHMEKLLKAKIYKAGVYGIIKCFVYFLEEDIRSNTIFDNYVDVFYKGEMEKMITKIREVFSKESNLFTKELYEEFLVKLNGESIEKVKIPKVFLSQGQAISAVSKEGDSKIKGVAGAGKTVVLAHRVVDGVKRIKRSDGGKPRVLILTYNITLRAYILGIIQNIYNGNEFVIEIKHYHKFIIDKGRELDIVISKESFNDINVFEDGRDKIEKYDCILIDEIQDYEINWQRIIKKYFLKGNGEYVLFGDEKQNIYERELDSLKKVKTNVRGNWRKLNKSFRVGGKLAEVALKFQREFLKNKYELDSEEELIYDNLFGMDQYIDYKKIKNLEEGVEYIYKLVNITEKIQERDIVFLTSKVEDGRNLKYIFEKKFKEKNLMSTFEEKEEYDEILKNSSNRVRIMHSLNEIRRNRKYNFKIEDKPIFSTIHSFKGWERETVIILISGGKSENNELIYTGLTRSRKNLIVLDISPDLIYEKFFRSIF